jgi:hypothetical protein
MSPSSNLADKKLQDKSLDCGWCAISSPVTVFVWISYRSGVLAMGFRDWMHIQLNCRSAHCVIRGRVVSCTLSRIPTCVSQITDIPLKPSFRLYHRVAVPPTHSKNVIGARTTLSARGLGRIQDLIGITGIRSARPDPSWKELLFAPFKLVWRPHLLSILIFEVCDINGIH